MNIKHFTNEAYKQLKQDLIINREKYYSDDEWLKDYFDSVGIVDYVHESSVTVPNISLVYSGDSDAEKNADDLQNIKYVYGNYKDKLTPADASDPLLWSALCHIDFREYVLKRWKKDDGTVRIDERFFARGARGSLLYYNALSRLWWSGYLTYEEEKERTNPWILTKTLMSAQQIQKDLFDQPYSMNRTVVKGLLRALDRIQEKCGNSATVIFRKCCDSFMNHYGAVTILDYLSADEIEKIAYSFMEQLL